MIAENAGLGLVLRLLAPLVWRSERRIAAKLEGFACTEAGSALDMLKAAELATEPGLRRLFFRHAIDEARHAQLFRDAARRLVANAGQRAELPYAEGERVSREATSEHNLIHATRQNLYERLGLLEFLAFVHLAERRGELQFRALAAHFRGRGRTELESLFEKIGREERFHVAYSGGQLRRASRSGRARAVRWALARVRLRRAWESWRRTGRVFGEWTTRAVLALVYLAVLPLFALCARLCEPARTGWRRRALSSSLEKARRQA